ncbi:MAG: hypothetical protein U9P90_01305, partial [Patescibacteria group bacterium]|nr:hypothetical protein [Patescibacteria group bacterium]
IFKKFKLSSEQESLYFDITDKVFYKELSLEDFPAEVEKAFGLEPEKSKALSLEILGNVFLPIDSYLGDVSAEIKKINGDPTKFVVEHIKLKQITPDDLLKKIAEDVGILLKNKSSIRRLKNIIVNRFHEARDDEETMATMMRGAKVGGLEFTDETARKVIQNIKAKIGEFQLADAETPLRQVQGVSTQKPKPPDNLPISSPQMRGGTPEGRRGADIKETTPLTSTEGSKVKSRPIFDVEDEREIAYHKKELERKKLIEGVVNFDEEVQKSIKNILEKGKFSFSDESLKQRFLNVVSARLRDVRDKSETLELFMRGRSIGGLGLKKQGANKILNLIEAEVNSLNQIKKKGELQKLEEWKKKKDSERKSKEEREKKEETRALGQRWTKLTGAKPSSTQPVVPPVIQSPQAKNLARAPQGDPRGSLRSREIPRAARDDTIKPKVEAIKFTPRLTGPIDELRKITLADFRRLAKSPKNIAEKIKDKIELLEDESYAKKTQGIKAWQESEPSKIYFEILNQSMSELMPVSDVLAQREQKKLPNLSQEEFKALIALNKYLRI